MGIDTLRSWGGQARKTVKGWNGKIRLQRWLREEQNRAQPAETEVVVLPQPQMDGAGSVAAALLQRRSTRRFGEGSLSLAAVAQLLWAAQGINRERGLRTVPSAGGTYPLQIYLASGAVAGLATGTYRYLPRPHALQPVAAGDVRTGLGFACLNQGWIRSAAAVIAVAANPGGTISRYGERGRRYVQMEAGHAQQNIHLQAAALQLGTVVVGAFGAEDVKLLLHLPAEEDILSLMPVGPLPAP